MERTSTKPRTNPDGDVSLALPLFGVLVTLSSDKVDVEHLELSYSDFTVPNCPSCLAENRLNSIVRTMAFCDFDARSVPIFSA